MKALLFAIFLGAPWTAAEACEAARLRFEGTSFAQSKIEIEKREIYFFRGERNQTRISRDEDGWCYESLQRFPQKPRRGCLRQELKRMLTLRDAAGKTVANLRVAGPSLYATLLDRRGKATGKQIQFTQTIENGARVLEVHGWNCPNPRFLSCVGAEVRTLPNYENVSERTIAEPVDLSQRHGHYRVSCAGVHHRDLKAQK